MKDERRYKILLLSPELILSCLQSDKPFIMRVEGIPTQPKIMNITFDLYTQAFALQIEHPCFDPVPPFNQIPVVPLTVTTMALNEEQKKRLSNFLGR